MPASAGMTRGGVLVLGGVYYFGVVYRGIEIPLPVFVVVRGEGVFVWMGITG